MGEKLLIATVVYDDYIPIFDKICLRSLFQKGNIPFLISDGWDIEYTVYTKQNANLDKLREVIDKYRRDDFQFDIREYNQPDNTTLIQDIVRHATGRQAKTLFLNPDYFYGNDSLKNIMQYRYKNNMCVAATHVRVDKDKFIEKISKVEGDVSNPKLVTMAMDCLHWSWSEAFIDKERNNSTISGSFVEPIHQNMWAVTFRIPTVFLASFEGSDKDALRMFNFWDHEWPSKLIKEHRYKFVGSSDFFFAVELTNTDDNLPEIYGNMLWNDEFHVTTHHGETNRNFLVILRGE